MRTIPRNHTKVIAELKAQLTECKRYDKSSGNMVVTDPANAWDALYANSGATLVEGSNKDKYTVHVHSNLFYVLRPAAAPVTTASRVYCDLHDGAHDETPDCLYPHYVALPGPEPRLGHPLRSCD